MNEIPDSALPPKTAKRVWGRRLALTSAWLAAVLLVPLPFKITTEDETRAVVHAWQTLVQDRRVLTDKGYTRLKERDFIEDWSRVYFHNETGLPDEVFLNLGLKPIAPGQKPNVDQGDVVVEFHRRGMMREPVANIQFTYVFGSLGAQCYELRILKCLLMRHFLYVHKWMA